MIARSDLMVLGDGQPLYFADDPASGLFAVVAGRVEMHFSTPNDDPTLAYVCSPGTWAGDTAALSGRSRRMTLIAGAGLHLLRLPRSELTRITQADPSTWQHFAQLLATNYFIALDVIDALRRTDPVERTAMTLANLLLERPDGEAIIRASQADIGAMAQLGRGTVNVALGELETMGLIRRGYAAIEVANVDGLVAFLAGSHGLLRRSA